MGWIDKVPKKNKNLAWRVIDGEAVIIPLTEQSEEGETINILNQTATRIWELCNSKNQVKDIIDSLSQEYDAEEALVICQVERTMNELLEKRLISV